MGLSDDEMAKRFRTMCQCIAMDLEERRLNNQPISHKACINAMVQSIVVAYGDMFKDAHNLANREPTMLS